MATRLSGSKLVQSTEFDIVYGSRSNSCALAFRLALSISSLHSAVSPDKDKTADHCNDPALSVLVMLVARNVFYRGISPAVS